MGLLDGLNMNDPQTMGLLGAAAQMLQASGPSLMPHSFGQVMGSGLQGMLQGQQTGLDRQKEQMQLGMMQQQFAQAQRRNTMIDNWLQGKNPDGSPAQAQGAAPSASPVPPQVLPMGSTDGDGRTISTPGFFPPADQQPAGAPPAQAGFGGLPRDVVMSDLAFGNGTNLSKFINERSAPTDLVKTAQQLNIPLSTVRDSQLADMATKGVMNVRPEGTLWKNGKPIFTAPSAAGQFTTWDDQGNPTSNLVPNAANVTQTLSRATAAGKAAVEPMTAYDAHGNPIFTNKLAAATGGAEGGPASDQPVKWNLPEPSPATLKMWQTSAQNGNKDAQLALSAYAQHKQSQQSQQAQPQALAPALAPGVEKSIAGNVDTMNSDFADLYAVNKNAPTTLALLDNIKKLAPLAITGAQADKLAFNNGLLALAGVPAAKDLAESTDLLNKNANMLAIRQRLGAGGGGSDALQVLAQAANPNNHMQPGAIIKAANELIGQTRMGQDMYNTLLPFKMSNDVQGYFGAQQKFSSQADPRTYQPDAQASGASPAAKGVPAAGQTFSMLPAAAQFAGKRMRADNGTIYRSDGTKWIKE